MAVEPTDVVTEALLGLASRGVTHPLLASWLRRPNPTFGGRTPAAAWREHPELVESIASLAARHDFRR